MTDPVTLTVAAVTASVAVAAGWYAIPSPPALDAERWFKVLLATVLRGQTESAGGDAVSWAEAVIRFVPYHPAGRLPEQKVMHPERFQPPGDLLDGERALLDALRRTPPDDRWARMYDDDELALAARLDDPVLLGPDYDPATWIGAGWDAVAAWRDLPDVLRARSQARWVLVHGAPSDAPDVLGALADVLGDRAVVVPWSGDPPDAAAEALAGTVAAAVVDHADRFVFVGAGEGAHLVTRALVADAGLRDRVLAVLSMGGVVLGRTGDPGPYGEAALTDWMGRWFRHAWLETEAVGRTPWFSLSYLDRGAWPPGVPGLPLASSRFPTPPPDRSEDWGVQPFDLGPLPADPALPVQAVARALAVFVVCWLAARGVSAGGATASPPR